MNIETASPSADTSATAGAQDTTALPDTTTEQHDDGKGADEKGERKELTPEQREIQRLRRGIDRRTEQRGRAQQRIADLERELAQVRRPQQHGETSDDGGGTTASDSSDEHVTLPRSEFEKRVEERARALAPQLKQQQDVVEHRRGVVTKLEQELGSEKFDELTQDLEDAFGGLEVAKGRPKAAVDAIFDSDMPRELIEYLADPDNADEAAALASMTPTQAGRKVAQLEGQIKAKKAADKPQPSNAPAPHEPVRSGGSTNTAPDPSNVKAWIKHQNDLERKGHL